MGLDRLGHVRKLYAYLSGTRKAYLDAFDAMPWDALTQERGAGGSIRDAFVRTLSAHRGSFEYVLQDKSAEAEPLDPAKYTSAAHLRTMEQKIDALVRETTRGLEPSDLSARHVDADGVELTTEDVLLHGIVDELQSRGEIQAMLRQAGVEPPALSYADWAHPPRASTY